MYSNIEINLAVVYKLMYGNLTAILNHKTSKPIETKNKITIDMFHLAGKMEYERSNGAVVSNGLMNVQSPSSHMAPVL